MHGLTKKELKILGKLDTPAKIQNFLDKIGINFEPHGATYMSPHMVLKTRKAHCFEGALLAATALRLQGQKPLIVDLVATREDRDHVIAVFKENGCWGAISKTNHAVLRYREPVYKTIRELVMSYFHEYFLHSGKKTLRAYSLPIDLSRFDNTGWITSEKNLWHIRRYLDTVPHYKILTPATIRTLRKADPIEIKAGKIVSEKE